MLSACAGQCGSGEQRQQDGLGALGGSRLRRLPPPADRGQGRRESGEQEWLDPEICRALSAQQMRRALAEGSSCEALETSFTVGNVIQESLGLQHSNKK